MPKMLGQQGPAWTRQGLLASSLCLTALGATFWVTAQDRFKGLAATDVLLELVAVEVEVEVASYQRVLAPVLCTMRIGWSLSVV